MNPSRTSSLGAVPTVSSAVLLQFGPAQPRFAPAWAERFGEDREGIFAEFALNGVLFEWRWVPPGRFWMGSPEDEPGRKVEEGPRHEVILTHGFWMGRTPVTQAQWRMLMKENPGRFQGDSLPVEKVSWKDAMAYCMRLNVLCSGMDITLPTEAQWEYACRAGTNGAFGDGSPCTDPEGKDPALDRLGWFSGNADLQMHPVGLKDGNAWGLHDMHGNVWEWCLDGPRRYSHALEVNPEGLMDGFTAGIRGGSGLWRTRSCRCAARNSRDRSTGEPFVGFRLVSGTSTPGVKPQIHA